MTTWTKIIASPIEALFIGMVYLSEPLNFSDLALEFLEVCFIGHVRATCSELLQHSLVLFHNDFVLVLALVKLDLGLAERYFKVIFG